ncbi:hypothetical protein [Aeromicrobium ginsengisoli]|uniref:Uncharacterized protein n=1 Tax=Aeromicrobium ginsengisoli TaxID=363867 RepID=A0A5M4FEI6_9ACTN|nr:hypothetical protein [Aeromicrobium ginsengisoli]KAA1397273.1 hypothetical protein ESP70_007720 [Aeromicrobium ginsengisoli]
MSNELIYLLIPAAAVVVFVLGAILVMKLQKKSQHVGAMQTGGGGAAPTGFQQAAGESREAFVRRNSQRPGVVANGVTLVDLYDRIAELEKRLADTEQQLEALHQR